MYKINIYGVCMKQAERIIDKRTDPSDIQQYFDDFQLKIHCCRYWKFSQWKLNNLSAPFWRLYYNCLEGAFISFGDQRYELLPNHIYVIPPNVEYSIFSKYDNSKEQITGNRILLQDTLETIRQANMIDHFFVHFNLGILHDNAQKKIYVIELNQQQKQNIETISSYLKEENRLLPFEIVIRVQALVLFGVSVLEKRDWNMNKYDNRILKVMNFIQLHIAEPITNPILAQKTHLATNSFARLFRQQTGLSVQKYIRQKRIEKALSLIHHSTLNYETIADECGFCDIHHFSKVFKAELKLSPSGYKKRNQVGG